ncbi:translocation/assembly module TamB domain-containing protein [uncultured Sulfitobacter sp.]|uniref:translocation/assembly module TamB domain-containing protein n=1 Tax=uncultured Sulfitobacter sp. TaxID=191468 RepID=UPI00262B87B4|nr:translocation/assembly module TamB domain-containing protein [uncultured Sulfitobacter sp.]
MRMIRYILMAFALVLALPAMAQEEDKGFLTRKIQELLSGAGREVSITGFTGALSSAASFERMTISDDEGVWLTMEDVVLDWNRSALLRGRLEVQELSAARIDLPRLPKGDEETLPDAEATPFSFPQLPDLPVSVDIAVLNIAQLRLGAPLVGQEVLLQMTANATLNDAGLDAAFQANRTDGKRGTFDLRATLSRDASTLDMLLRLSEQADGIAANLLDIPDKPSVDLTVQADGPLDDLRTDIKVDTDGAERLAGVISITTQGSASDPDRQIVADIGGDLTAVILPEYRDFFGNDVSLRASALLESSGAITLDRFALKAAAVDLEGRAAISENNWPTLLDIEGRVARADGAPVVLPGGGGAAFVDRIVLDVDYDATNGDAYEASFNISGLQTDSGTIEQSTLRSTGTLTGAQGNLGQLRGVVQFATQGVALVDAALAEALGAQLTGSTEVNYITDQPLRLSNLQVQGSDYSLKGDIAFGGLGSGVETEIDAQLIATDLSRFSALAGRELDGATTLALSGTIVPLSGAFDLDAKGTADNIKTGIAQADAVLEGRTDLTMKAIRNENGTFLRDLELSNAALLFTGSAELASTSSRVDADIVLRDIASVLPQYEGRVVLKGAARENGSGWRVDVTGDGPYDTTLSLEGLATGPDAALAFDANVPELSPFAEGIEGPLRAEGTLRQTPQGWLLQTDAAGPFDATARLNGLVTPSVDLGFDMAVPQIAQIVPQVSGPVRATGRLRQTDTGFDITTDASGPYNADLSVTGALTPAIDVAFDLALPNLQPLVPQVNGPLRAKGQLRQSEQGFVIDTTASGPYGARAAVEGLATGPDMALEFDVSLPNVAPFAPGVNGPLTAKGNLRQTPAGIALNTNATGPYSSRASARGVVTGPNAAVDFTLAMPNIAALVPKLNGPLNVNGAASKTTQGWQLDTSLRGPSGTQASVAGLVGNDGRLNIGINGNAPLGLAGPFIAPRNLQGQARFDLRLDGPAGLDALSGQIQTSGATLTAPNFRVGLEGIDADIRLANSRAQLDITASATGGGRLGVAGSVALSGAQVADLGITLNDVVLVDPRLYRTSLSGALRLSGPLSGGAGIAGNIVIGETNVTVPSTGLTSIGDIPPITHIGAPDDNRATRRRAGLLEEGAASDPVQNGSSGGGFGLDINVNAPGRIFVRGRGLDAELGGNLRITGRTDAIVSSGRFELLRGRLDILGKRFDLEEGSAQFQGDFIPYIRFVSTTSTQTGTASVIVEGPADAPEVTFESTPAGPQDEVLAQLLFGRNLSEISAFQALQLANAVATLAGRGGNGVVGNLRDRFGLDDLDVTTTDSGETALRVGKYLTDNVYTDVTAASDGTGEVSLNIDITPNLKGKATLGSDGNSSIGLFFEKDY